MIANDKNRYLEALLDRLDDPNASIREAAIAEARDLRVEDLWWLANRDEQVWRTRQKSRTVLKAVTRSGLSVLARLLHLCTDTDDVSLSSHRGHVPQSLAQVVAESEDPRLVGLALTLRYRNRLDYVIAGHTILTIKRLLPQLSTEQLHTLTQKQGRVLITLMSPYDLELTLAILKALEEIGGEGAIPHVQRIKWLEPVQAQSMGASTKMLFPLDKEERHLLYKAAAQCLIRLRQNAEQERQANLLLRASDAPVFPEQLLRSTSNPVESTPPEQLLRPPRT